MKEGRWVSAHLRSDLPVDPDPRGLGRVTLPRLAIASDAGPGVAGCPYGYRRVDERGDGCDERE